MPSENTRAIVLRVVPFSETSVVVALLTRDFGRTSALAKGAYRPKGPFEGALDLLSICRVTLIRKHGDALDLLTEAKLERRFRAASRDLGRLYAGYYVVELLRELTHEGDPHPALYELAERTLIELDARADVAGSVARFEMRCLHLLGQSPRLDRCAACGSDVEPAARVAFGMLAGGVLCGGCRSTQRQVVSLSRELRRAMAGLSRDPGPAADALSAVAGEGAAWAEGLPADIRGEYRGVMNRYFANLLGHRPRMQGFLGFLVGE